LDRHRCHDADEGKTSRDNEQGNVGRVQIHGSSPLVQPRKLATPGNRALNPISLGELNAALDRSIVAVVSTAAEFADYILTRISIDRRDREAFRRLVALIALPHGGVGAFEMAREPAGVEQRLRLPIVRELALDGG